MKPEWVQSITLSLFMLAALVVVLRFQTRKTGERLAAMGKRLGLRLTETGRFFKQHRLGGTFRGRGMQIFSFSTGSGKTRKTWVAISVKLHGNGRLHFHLKRRAGWFDVFDRVFRRGSIPAGDPVFDQKWVMRTNEIELMRAVLLPETREKIMRLTPGWSERGRYTIDRDELRYQEMANFNSEKRCVRLEEIAHVVCDLADAVEVGAEIQR